MKSEYSVKYLIHLLFSFFPIYANAQVATLDRSYLKNDSMAVNQIKIVLMGNSITEMWPNSRPDFFINNPYLVSKGIGGQTSDQMLARFQKDVINLKPTAVVILAGINDIAENNGPISIPDIMKNIAIMAQIAQDEQIKVVLCTLLPANQFTWRPRILPADKVIALNNLIKAYAAANNFVLVNYYDNMVDDAKGLKVELGPDGVHPNVKGYAIMEELLVKGLYELMKEEN
jgi:lysophospholipase L1-like esterase